MGLLRPPSFLHLSWGTGPNIVKWVVDYLGRTRARRQPEPGERGPGRVVAFTDAVIAIAVTLLVLDIRPPEDTGGFLLQGSGERPPCVGWDAERRTVAVGGVAHHHAFGRRDFDALAAVAAAVAALTPVVHIPVILSIRASDSLAL